MKICDGVYAYIWQGSFENNCNMYYFADPINILFDPGLKHHLDLRFQAMTEDGLNPDDIKMIVNTHCHPDHFEGSVEFMKKDVSVAMSKDEIDFLNTEGPGFFSIFNMEFPTFEFDTILQPGPWQVSGTELEIINTPGHSPGFICVYWPEKKAMVSGDLIFKESFGRYDFPGGDVNKLKDSIVKLADYEIDYLLPGHMEMLNGSDEVKRNFELVTKYVLPMI